MNLILANTGVTYLRSLLALCMGLFSARWVLSALGASDFGLYAVVGSLTAFAGFFGDLLRISVTRNLAYALGQGDDERSWFGSALVIHVTLALGLVAVVWPVGEWVIRCVLQIPEGRLAACLWVFRLSLLSVFSVTVGIPFAALFTAHQRFADLAVFGIGQTMFVFACAFELLSYEGDRLVCYGAYMSAGLIGVQLVQAVRALAVFPACRLTSVRAVSREKIRAICSFAGWNALGGGGYLVAIHGSSFVTNRLFGPVANAAYGVAQQVQYHTEALAEALVAAFTPAVTERRGADDRPAMLRLARQAGLGGAVLLVFFALPLILEIHSVLGLWLGTPPKGAAEICSVMLGSAVLNKLTMGQQLALAADGRVAGWQTVSGVVQVCAVPLTVLAALLGGSFVSAALAYVVVVVGCVLSNLYFGHRVSGMKAGEWLMRTCLPFFSVLGLAAGAGLVPRCLLEAGFGRIVLTSLCTSAVFVCGGLLWKRSISR